MQWNMLQEQCCSIARTLSVIGDRWTLLVLRDCFHEVRRFEDLQARLGIARAILSDRLTTLIEAGVLERVEYQVKPVRHEYRLTPKGLDLYPVLMSIVHWGDVHMGGDEGRPLLHRHRTCGRVFDPVLACSECGGALHADEVEVMRGPGARDREPTALVAEAGERHPPTGTGAPA